MNDHRIRTMDPFVLKYHTSELQIAAEFLTNWLPFLSKDLCHKCSQTLCDRVRSLDPELCSYVAPMPSKKDFSDDSSLKHPDKPSESNENHDDCDTNSLGSWKDSANEWSEQAVDVSTSGTTPETATVDRPAVRMSWADMAQEDELENEGEEEEPTKQTSMVEFDAVDEEEEEEEEGRRKVQKNPGLSRDQREYIRFMKVQRKKDFICFERINGKLVNILEGLELHTHVFSAAEQKRIVDHIYALQEMGRKGELRERTYSAPRKWMQGKGRVTIQFGCCYNYATDRNGNPPGILRSEYVDPIPHLFKVIIRRLVGWHVLPPTCVPDSCIVNIYDKGDCIPPHIDNHDFVRPFCTVSFLSECDIVFGSNLKIVGDGEFAGPIAISLPIGSVLVLNGNGADVAKHCVPSVPTKRISITFRKMDDSKHPIGFVPEPDLQGLQPLAFDMDESKRFRPMRSQPQMNRQPFIREGSSEMRRGFSGRGNHSELHQSSRTRPQLSNRRRGRVNLDT